MNAVQILLWGETCGLFTCCTPKDITKLLLKSCKVCVCVCLLLFFFNVFFFFLKNETLRDISKNRDGLKVHPWSQSPGRFMQLLTCCHAGPASRAEAAIRNSQICLEIRRPSACFYFVRCCPNSHRGLILLKCKLVGTRVHVRQCVCVHVCACVRFWDQGQTPVKWDKNGNHAFSPGGFERTSALMLHS